MINKMIKKSTFLGTVLAATAVFAACGAPASNNDGGGSTTTQPPVEGNAPAVEGGSITLVSNKIEIDAPLRAFAALYEEKTGVRVEIRSFGGETPYAPALAAMFASGAEPEIFAFEGLSGYEDAKEGGRITDLSDQPWVSDTDLARLDEDGHVVGFPVAVEGWGLAYNKALLEQAGVDPATMINIEGIRAAFDTINEQADELGIMAPVSMAAGPGMTWVTGLHGLNAYLSLGLDFYDTSILDMMNAGQVDEARLAAFSEYYQLIFENSISNTLNVGGYDQQLGDFAVGRTVFLHQGNWVDPTFAELGVDFEMGYVPHAFLEEDTDGIFVDAPVWYLVNAQSENAELAKDFLTFMATSPEGHNYMVNEAGMVPAFKSVTLVPSGPLSAAVQEWSNKGKIYAWHQNELPSGFGMNTLGPIFSEMASGNIDSVEFARLFTVAVANIGPNE